MQYIALDQEKGPVCYELRTETTDADDARSCDSGNQSHDWLQLASISRSQSWPTTTDLAIDFKAIAGKSSVIAPTVVLPVIRPISQRSYACDRNDRSYRKRETGLVCTKISKNRVIP